MTQISVLEEKLRPLREELKNHVLYKRLRDISDVAAFAEQHVFAVWDFMSLLKFLQNELTCTQVPWVPKKNAAISRFINEIVHGEESDVNEVGEPKSHFEMYLDAMEEVGSNTTLILTFLDLLEMGVDIHSALNKLEVSNGVKNFVHYTFELIETGSPHKVASAFTFGREDVIPDMFLKILDEAGSDAAYPKFRYYLRRHIELDGDEHGPISLKMVELLCGDDVQKWKEAEEVAMKALEARIALWNAIELVIRPGLEP